MTFGELPEKTTEEFIIPPGLFELSFHRAFGAFQSGEVERQSAQEADILGSIILAVALAILVHRHVQHPMQSVLDAPLGARHLGEPRRGKRRTSK